MKNHELLDRIGEVNEDYVLAAGDNVVKPRFRWKTLAACAACAALVLGAYPVYRAVNPPLHDYTVVEGGGMATLEDVKVPARGTDDESRIPNPALTPVPGGAYVGGDAGETGMDGIGYDVPGQDAPVQEAAQAQYQELLQGLGGQGGYLPETYPDWYGGAWIDNSYYPEAKLAVAIVDGFRTPELEAQIEEWCGGEVVFRDVKYSHNFLDGLMEPVTSALDGTGLSCGIGVDVMENCLGVDIYSDGKDIPEEVLAKLAQLDPDGGAIRVRLFTQSMSTLTDEIVKGPAPGGDPDAYVPAPGAVEDADRETTQIAPDPNTLADLPQAKYDAIAEGE